MVAQMAVEKVDWWAMSLVGTTVYSMVDEKEYSMAVTKDKSKVAWRVVMMASYWVQKLVVAMVPTKVD